MQFIRFLYAAQTNEVYYTKTFVIGIRTASRVTRTKMSCNIFPQHYSTPETSKPATPTSKIPIPSPRSLRRSFSLRMKNEKLTATPVSVNEACRRSTAIGRFSTMEKNKDHTAQSLSNNGSIRGCQLLRRRHSFMASGERGDENNGGSGEKYAVAKRPDHVKISPAGGVRISRSPCESDSIRKGGCVITPDTPSRVRSLVSRTKCHNY